MNDFDANRYQNSKAMIEFVAGCFDDASYFRTLSVFVTHADDGDEPTLGRLRCHLRKLNEVGGLNVAAFELLRFLESEVHGAVSAAELRRENRTRVRVVRPCEPENRRTLLQCLEGGDRITDPGSAFRFHLESDARRTVDSLVGAEHQNICRWLAESFEYGRVGAVLVDLDAVGQALGREVLKAVNTSRSRVLQANETLFNEIKQAIQSSLNAPVDEINVAQLASLVPRFRAMQVIQQHAGGLLPAWKTFQCLMWDYHRDLESYVDVERQKRSWEALEGCARRIELLGAVLECDGARELAESNVSSALAMQREEVLAFADPVSVSEALLELQRAGGSFTGARRERAAELFQGAAEFLRETLGGLVRRIAEVVQGIGDDSAAPMTSDSKAALIADVTRLYKFTRPDQRIDDFLPEDARSCSVGGLYKQFLQNLRLDRASESALSRPQLLKHSNLLACLMKVEDDELRIKLELHMDSLRAQIEGFLRNDFELLRDTFESALPSEPAVPIDSLVERQIDAVTKFNAALMTAAQLLQIDEVSRDKACTAQFSKFFDVYNRRIAQIEGMARHGFASSTALAQGVAAYLLCRDGALGSLKIACDAQKQRGLGSLVQEVQAVTGCCMKIIQDKSSEECRSIEAQAQSGGFDFGSANGLRAADEALVKLDLLCVVAPGDGAALRLGLQRDYADFVELHTRAFQAQETENPRSVNMEAMLDAFKSLLPAARAEGLLRLPKDPKLLEYLARGVGRAEASLMVLADERLDSMEIAALLRNVKHVMLWKHLDEGQTVGTQVAGLKDARDALMQRLERALQEARAAVELARFDVVAGFAERCSDADRAVILSDASYSLRGDVRVIRKLATQLSWLEADQVQKFC